MASSSELALLEEFLEHLAVVEDRSQLTVAAYRRDLLRALEWLEAHRRGFASATREDLEAYLDSLGGELSPRSIAQ